MCFGGTRNAIIIILFPYLAVAQEPAQGIFPIVGGQIRYEKIITADSMSKDDLYKSVLSWGTNSFKSQVNAMQASDRETGLVTYKYFFPASFKTPPLNNISVTVEWKYWCVMKIFLKENKLKVVIDDISISSRMDNIEINNSVLTFRKDGEDQELKSIELYKKSGINYKKYSLTPEYKEAYYKEVRQNFIFANARILATISDFEKQILSGKSEFDF